MSDPTYRWAAHPHMEPRTEAYFIGYWTTMPRPVSERDAKRSFIQAVRRGELVVSQPLTDAEMLALACG